MPVSTRPDGPIQAIAVGVGVGGLGEGVGGIGVAVLVGVRVGTGVAEDVRVAVGVKGIGVPVMAGVKITATGEVTASLFAEQAANPILRHRLDTNSTAAFTILLIS